METLSNEIKRYLSIYSKNTGENNLEISIGNSLGKYIFDTNVSNKYWKKIRNIIEDRGEYTVQKKFTYRIYTSGNMKLYIDKDDKMRCIKSTLKESSLCYNNTKGVDFKISFYNKKPINIAKFPSRWEYDNSVERETISYTFNGFYINLSCFVPIGESVDVDPIYTITILLSKNNKVSRNIILKNIMKQIRDIYTLFNIKDEIMFKIHTYVGTE